MQKKKKETYMIQKLFIVHSYSMMIEFSLKRFERIKTNSY